MQTAKIVLDGGIMPVKATEGSACFDLYVPDDFDLKPGRQVLDLGLRIQLPHNMAAIIRSRSGFASKGLEVTVDHWYGTHKARIDADVLQGCIDEDYRGHIGVIVNVHTDIRTRAFIPKGTRIAQMMLVDVPEVSFKQVESLDETERGDGGFGHSDTKGIVKRGRKKKEG